jgi:hypothetical protein
MHASMRACMHGCICYTHPLTLTDSRTHTGNIVTRTHTQTCVCKRAYVRTHTSTQKRQSDQQSDTHRGGTVAAAAKVGAETVLREKCTAAKHTNTAVRHMPSTRRRLLTLTGVLLPKTRPPSPPTMATQPHPCARTHSHTHELPEMVPLERRWFQGGQSRKGLGLHSAGTRSCAFSGAFSEPPSRQRERPVVVPKDVPVGYAHEQRH